MDQFKRISQRKRVDLRFGSHASRMEEIERVLIQQHQIIGLLRQSALKVEVDVDCLLQVAQDLTEELPWWKRLRFPVGWLEKLRESKMQRRIGMAAAHSLAATFQGIRATIDAAREKVGENNGDGKETA